jgi:hypothetical protein
LKLFLLGAFRARHIATIVGVAAVWIIFFRLNALLFGSLGHSHFAHWIFLPAAVRILAVLIFESPAAWGLILGAYATSTPDNALSVDLAICFMSGLAPYIAVQICRKYGGLASDLAGMTVSDIIRLSFFGALANTALLNLTLFLLVGHRFDFIQLTTVFVGDLLGTALVIYALAAVMWLVSIRRKA